MRLIIIWTIFLFSFFFVNQLQLFLNVNIQSRIVSIEISNNNNIDTNKRWSKKKIVNKYFKNLTEHELSLFKESLHLNELKKVCSQSIDKKRGSPIISWNHVDNPKEFKLIYRGDFLLHEELSNCPVIDVYMAKGMKFIYL